MRENIYEICKKKPRLKQHYELKYEIRAKSPKSLVM